jgi:hypothetical protein
VKQLEQAGKEYGISRTTGWTIVIAPFVILLGFSLLISLEQTWEVTDLMTHRGYPVEWTSFGVHLLAGVYGLRLAWLARKNREPRLIYLFYFLFALALLFVAGEINAWGQKFFDYHTPAWFRHHNALRLVTLHNIHGFDNNNHRLRLIFALGGFLGIALQKSARWNHIAAPPILGWWFGVILFKCLLDFWVKDFPITSSMSWLVFNWTINRISKIVKVMIGISAFLYLWLNKRRLRKIWAETPMAAA